MKFPYICLFPELKWSPAFLCEGFRHSQPSQAETAILSSFPMFYRSFKPTVSTLVHVLESLSQEFLLPIPIYIAPLRIYICPCPYFLFISPLLSSGFLFWVTSNSLVTEVGISNLIKYPCKTSLLRRQFSPLNIIIWVPHRHVKVSVSKMEPFFPSTLLDRFCVLWSQSCKSQTCVVIITCL